MSGFSAFMNDSSARTQWTRRCLLTHAKAEISFRWWASHVVTPHHCRKFSRSPWIRFIFWGFVCSSLNKHHFSIGILRLSSMIPKLYHCQPKSIENNVCLWKRDTLLIPFIHGSFVSIHQFQMMKRLEWLTTMIYSHQTTEMRETKDVLLLNFVNHGLEMSKWSVSLLGMRIRVGD